MKKIIITTLLLSGLIFASCESNTYNEVSGTNLDNITNPTYVANVKPIIDSNCISCHKADSGVADANQIPLDTYATVKEAITGNDLIADIESGDMPQDGTRLSESTVNLIKRWAANVTL